VPPPARPSGHLAENSSRPVRGYDERRNASIIELGKGDPDLRENAAH
jgi:hypothetical protein